MAEGDPELRRWVFVKPYTNLYFLRGGTHRRRALKLGTCQKMAVRKPKCVSEKLESVAVQAKKCNRHFVSVPTFRRNWKANGTLCVPFTLMFAYYFSAFSYNAQRIGFLLQGTAIKKFTIMSCTCFFTQLGAAKPICSSQLAFESCQTTVAYARKKKYLYFYNAK